jgi:hypothetical protein
VTLTANVSANAPSTATTTGIVTFKEGTKTLGSAAISSGRAILNATELEIGAHTITASFAASANFLGSNGTAKAKVTPKLGPEFLVNTVTANVQQTPAIVRLAADAFVVVWASNLQDGSGYGIYGQRYNSNGAKFGVEFRVNTMTAGSQTTPAVTALSDGGFVVVWVSAGQDRSGTGIIAQHYSPTGAKVGAEFVVNTTTAGDQSTPAVAGFANGGFVVAWTSPDASGAGVYAQRYDATGDAAGKEFLVNTVNAGDQTEPAIATLSNGTFVIVWQSDAQDGSLLGIYGQRYEANGLAQGAEFRVNTTVADSQSLPSVTGTADGGFVIVWQSGAVPDILAQRYNANGVVLGSEFVVNTRTAAAQTQPAIFGFDDGGFVIFWTSNNQDGSGLGVFGQIYSPTGLPMGGEFDVNTTTLYSQAQPSLVASGNGNFVGVWTSQNQDGSLDGVYGQRFNAPMELGTSLTLARRSPRKPTPPPRN